MDMDFDNMSKDELIKANKKLYSRLKKIKQAEKETDKRSNLITKGASIRNKGITFVPRKTLINKFVERIVGGLYVPNIIEIKLTVDGVWKVSLIRDEKSDRMFNKNNKTIWLVNENQPYKITILSKDSSHYYEDLEAPMISYELLIVKSDFETPINKDYLVKDIPISSQGYGICYC